LISNTVSQPKIVFLIIVLSSIIKKEFIQLLGTSAQKSLKKGRSHWKNVSTKAGEVHHLCYLIFLISLFRNLFIAIKATIPQLTTQNANNKCPIGLATIIVATIGVSPPKTPKPTF